MSIDFDGAAERLREHLGKAPPNPEDMVAVEATDFALVLMERYTLLSANRMQAGKIEGMESDLFLAVETAYKRGAVEWTRLNYPAYYERLKAGE